jgi:hypothetical protein
MSDTDTDLISESLRVDANRRRRAAGSMSADLEQQESSGKDIRSGAVKLARLLAQAERLSSIADALDRGVLTLAPAARASVVHLRSVEESPLEPEDVKPADDGGDVITTEDGLQHDLLPTHQGDEVTEADMAEADALVNDINELIEEPTDGDS